MCLRLDSNRLSRALRRSWSQGGASAILSGVGRLSRKWSRDLLLDRLGAPRAIAELGKLPPNLSHEQVMKLAFELGGGLIAPSQIEAEFLALLKLIYGEPRPMRIMEIGSFRGGTLFCACRLAAPDAQIISLDLPGGEFGAGYPGWKQRLYQAFAQTRQSLHLIRSNSHLPESLVEVRRILADARLDFLFIDGDHSYAGVKQDFAMYSPLVRSGGWVAFHDVIPNLSSPSIEVHRFWDEIKVSHEHREFISQRERGVMGIGALRIP